MGEYDDMFRPSVDQRLQQAARERADLSAAIDQIAALRAENERLKGELAAYEAQAQSEQTTVLDSWIRRCNELECERNRLDGELREAQATIERVRELREAAHEAVSVFGREALSGHALDTLERLQSALASAKPEPTVIAAKGSINEAEARPGRRLGGGER